MAGYIRWRNQNKSSPHQKSNMAAGSRKRWRKSLDGAQHQMYLQFCTRYGRNSDCLSHVSKVELSDEVVSNLRRYQVGFNWTSTNLAGLWKLNPNNSLGLPYGLTGSRNSRWQTSDWNFHLNIYISARRQHRNKISQAKLMFFCPPIHETTGNVVRLTRKWEIQDGGLQNRNNIYLSL